MTAISHNFNNSAFNDFVADNAIYQVTAVTFDGDEINLHVEADSEEDAAEQVAAIVPEVDYILF